MQKTQGGVAVLVVVGIRRRTYLRGEPETGCTLRTLQMSTNTTNVGIAHGHGWTHFTAWLSRAFDAYVARRARTDQLQALEALSDAELAQLGIRRDQIVQYVFRDLYWA